MRYQVLGPLRVFSDGEELTLGGPKQRLVLALLISAEGQSISVGRLTEGVWGEEWPTTARKTLQNYVHRLRGLVGDALHTEGNGYRLDTGGDLDAIEFAQLHAEARELVDVDPSRASSLLRSALSLWDGPAYADLEDEVSLAPEVARLEELRVAVIGDRIDVDMSMGADQQLIGELEGLTHEYPMQERFRAQHMTALYRAGRHVEALRSFERMRRYLNDNAGVEPSVALGELEHRILVRDETLLAETSAVGVRPASVRGYELREAVSSGPGGDLYRAYQRSVGRQVSVRVIGGATADDPIFISRFLSDTQLLASLDHPNIGFVFDTWREPGRAFQVSRWFEGGSLAEETALRSLGLGGALRVLDEIGAALSYSHRRSVVHGHLDRSCVRFDSSGTAFLCDFAVGEPQPEHGVAADFDAFVCLAHELVVGRPPRWVQGTPQPDTAGRDLPAGVASVFESVLGKEKTNPRIEHFLRGLRQAAGVDVVSPASPPEAVKTALRNPYKGLRAFQESDADDFYGRDELIERLVERLEQKRLVAVVGPSGSGKSSVVRAGLTARVRSGAVGQVRLITEMFPGAFPFEELEGALLRVGVNRTSLIEDLIADDRGLLRVVKQILPGSDAELFLVIDQFEELFALVPDDATRELFMSSLVTAATDPRSRLRIVITLRADFFDRPLEHPHFGPLVEAGLVTVSVPDEDALADMIEAPALSVGLQLVPGLVPLIVSEVAGQPGGLPLLQYALTELVESRDSDLLSLEAYQRSGGVNGALARRAERMYQELAPAGRHAIRQAFLHMVSVEEGTDDLRRRVRQVELAAADIDDRALVRALQLFGSHRLLTFDQDPVTRGPTVEVAHEALLREWGRLSGWIQEHHDDLVFRRRLGAALQEWESSGREQSFLLGGGRLEQAETWRSRSAMSLTAAESDFIDESRRVLDESTTGRARTRRRVLVVLSSLLVVAIVLAGVAWTQRGSAERRATESAVQRLAAAAIIAVDEDPDLAILLALEAYDRAAALDAVPGAVVSALQTTVQSSRLLFRLEAGSGVAAISPDGSLVAVGSVEDESVLIIVDGDTGVQLSSFDTGGEIGEVLFSPDGSSVVVAYWDNELGPAPPSQDFVRFFDADTARPTLDLSAPGGGYGLRFSGDGRYLAATTSSGDVVVWDTSLPESSPEILDSGTYLAGWLPDNRTLTVHQSVFDIDIETPVVRFIDVTTGERTEMTIEGAYGVNVHPDGDLLVAATLDGVELWEPGALVPSSSIDYQLPTTVSTSFAAGGDDLYLFGQDDAVEIRSLGSGEVRRLRGHPDLVGSVASSADGTRLVASTLTQTLVWDLSPTGPPELANLASGGFIWSIELSADGSTGTITENFGPSGRVRKFDLGTGEAIASSDDWVAGEFPALALPMGSAESARVAGVGAGGNLTVDGGESALEVEGCQGFLSLDDLGRWLVTNCAGRGVAIDILTGEVLTEWPTQLGLSDIGPSGTQSEGLVAAQVDTNDPIGQAIELRNLVTGTVIGVLDTSGLEAWRPFFSADGRFLSFGSGLGAAWVIDIEAVLDGQTMEEAIVFTNQTDGGPTTFSVAGGDYLVTGHSNEILRFWELDSGDQWLSLPVDTRAPTMLAFTADGRYLYYADMGGLVRRFPLDPAELANLARSRVQRDFSVEECERFLAGADCSAYG